MVADRLRGQTAVLTVPAVAVELLLLVIVLNHILGDLVQRHLTEEFRKVDVVGGNVAGVGGWLSGGRRLVKLQPLQKAASNCVSDSSEWPRRISSSCSRAVS